MCTLETIYLFCDGKNILYTFAEFWSCEKRRSFCFYLVFQTFMESVLHQFCEYVAGIWSCCWNVLFSWRNLEGKHQFPTAFLIRRNITRIFLWSNRVKGFLKEKFIIWQCLLLAVQKVSVSLKQLCKEAIILEHSQAEKRSCCLPRIFCLARQWTSEFQSRSPSASSLFMVHCTWPLTTGHKHKASSIHILIQLYPHGGMSIRSSSTLPLIIPIISTKWWGRCLLSLLISLYKTLLRWPIAGGPFVCQILITYIMDKLLR